MRVLSVDKMDDCIDGNRSFGYVFDTPWTREAVARLRILGEVELFLHLPRPYFRVIGVAGLRIEGLLGDDTCRAAFPPRRVDARKREFEALFR